MMYIQEKEWEEKIDKIASLEKKLAKYHSTDRTVVEITKSDLKNILNENEMLKVQVTQLQEAATKAVEDRRKYDMLYNVTEFHNKFKYPVRTGTPTSDIPEDEIRHRARLIAEECMETLQAIVPECNCLIVDEVVKLVKQWIEEGTVKVNLPEVADGLVDLEYVIAGTHLAFAIPRNMILEEVQRANMSKDLSRDGLNKPVKPEGWAPPDIEGVLRRNGWVG